MVRGGGGITGQSRAIFSRASIAMTSYSESGGGNMQPSVELKWIRGGVSLFTIAERMKRRKGTFFCEAAEGLWPL